MTKENEIAGLLSEGFPAAELVRSGYTRSTVYKVNKKVNKRLQQPSTPEQPGTAQATGDTTAVADAGLDPAIEADQEIAELRKAIRRAELKQQLADIKAPVRFEQRLATGEKTVAGITTALKGMLEDLADLRDEVEGSPLHGLREKFRCACGQTGLVAAHVVCTSCGAGTTYGWQPE